MQTPVSAAELRKPFDEARELTIGIEEEVMLLDPATLDLAPVAAQVLERLGGDPMFKLELPASQLEIVTPPRRTVAAALEDLARGRTLLGQAAEGIALPATVAAHPFAAAEGQLDGGQRGRALLDEYGDALRRQLVCALQVHVAVPGAERALAVYNALRGLLPEVAALAAAAPFYLGRDSNLASVRPTIAQQLPRQGVPPAIPDWDALAGEFAWGAATGAVPEPRRWWWELRPHVTHGTLEVRVPDVQATLADTAGVAAFVHGLVGWLCERFDAGGELPSPPTWRIAENRWSACRDGVTGELADLATGELRPTRERLAELFDVIEPAARRLDCLAELKASRRLSAENGAMRQRELAAREGVSGLARRLTELFGAV